MIKSLPAKRKYGLVIALLILIAMFVVPIPQGLTAAGIRTLGCTLSLLVCLSTGALPLGLASLLFMMLYYVLGATDSLNVAISGMAAPPVLFILASFGMSAAVSESPISRRILHGMLKVFGHSIRSTLLGLMFATALVSAFISNVPVTAMFVTIGLAFLQLYNREEDRKQTGRTYMIAIPVAAMILLWILSSWISAINLYVVAVVGVAVLLLPGVDVLEWESFKRSTNWDVVFVTASVISLGNVINENGLSTWLVDAVFPSDMALPAAAIVFLTAVFVILMLLVVPISGALIQVLAGPLIAAAASCGVEPVILIITLCFCATNCYLLPIDTVPLLAYSTGYFQMTDMPRATAPVLLLLAILCALWCPVLCGILLA